MTTPAPTPEAEAADTSFAALLRIRPYRMFWFTRLTTQLANQMMMVALGWQMYDLTGSAWDLGLVGLAQFLPALLLTLPAGHMADRLHRARILQATTLAQGLVALMLVLASHDLWINRELILLLSVALGVAKAFQMPASQALPALLVPGALLARAVAVSSSGMQLAIIAGPAIGGLLYTAGAAVVYALCGALFITGSGLAIGIRHADPVASTEARSWASVFAGVHYLRGQPVLLGAISLDLFAVLLGGATALLPMFAKDILHTGPWGLGLLRAAPAAGALLMSAWLSSRPAMQHAGRWLIGSVAIFGVCMLVFGLSTSLWLSIAALALSGAVDMVSVVIRQTLVQLETPDAMRGRVSAVNSVFIGASNQLGEFESGATAALLGPVGSVVLGGVGVLLVAGLWVKIFPALWRRGALLPPGHDR
ncbi:major facilitator superfamily MFS_1 [Leptothrix cholodnii SP-6]|uniref:Major facilitator superfamily MFS_1 n=1 Tax=Leptothrix cholodnii (strain ATCC 51168 / LMG 8142 / SP-6) TaxID=395495 RepID=B1Y3U4_LEPCP|nr:MFS transporter [Leptothrix cholodnii]ACB33338.1 major facilitator superfamily MFS_1 [Leptothrix cholodnii SP-6]